MISGNNTISILNTNTNPAIGFSESCGKATVLDSEYPGELLVSSFILRRIDSSQLSSKNIQF